MEMGGYRTRWMAKRGKRVATSTLREIVSKGDSGGWILRHKYVAKVIEMGVHVKKR
jgi:hypothetical protein